MKKYNNRKLSDNFYEVYIGDKRRVVKNKSAYILSCALFTQFYLVMKSLLSFLL